MSDWLEILAEHKEQKPIVPPHEYTEYLPANDRLWKFHESDAKVKVIFGGNRSGKSKTGAKDILDDALRTPAGIYWCFTNSYAEVGAYVWPSLKKFWPESCWRRVSWVKSSEQIPSVAVLPNGATFYFKTYDQGRKRCQGADIDGAWLDEEPPYDIYLEVLTRLVDRAGTLRMTMTPLNGLTWPHDKILGTNDSDIFHMVISFLENRYIPEPEKQRYIARLSSDEYAMRVEGKFMLPTGRVFKELQERHFIEPFKIPREWDIVRSIDFGYANQFVCLWLAISPDGKIYCIAEHAREQMLLRDHARMISEIEHKLGVTVCLATIADHDAQDRAELEDMGIVTTAADKQVDLGIQIINRLFKADELFIFNTCVITKQQCSQYRFDKNGKPLKIDDHTCDGLRYGGVWIVSNLFRGGFEINSAGERVF